MTIKEILTKIGTFLGLIKDEAVIILDKADQIVDKIEVWEQSTEGQLIVDDAEAIVTDIWPAANIPVFLSWLATFFKDLKWADTEVNKTDTAIVQDGLTFVKSTVGDTKAIVLNTLNAGIAKHISDAENGELSIQQTLAAAQVVHSKAVIDTSAVTDDTPPVVKQESKDEEAETTV